MAASMHNVQDLSEDVHKLLKEYPDLEFQKNNHKIRCSLSGHEMPCKAQAVRDYVKGKKFIKLQKDKEFNYDRFKPHITANSKKYHEHQLFCLLTLSHINKTPRHVMGHVSGRKYKKELERWKKCQETGETFRPLRAQKRKRGLDIESEDGKSFLDSDADSDGSEDSFSDLYPPEHFGSGDPADVLDSDSSYEFEDTGDEKGKNRQETSQSQSEGQRGSNSKKTFTIKKKKKNKEKKMKTK